ncbi:hypothetical protein JB92DRAFT_3123197 [Gautieria morchelliformis]|nr:hypothetical protein JB92DRAFT_3123197 [Gautieria morchelliformis]
MALARRHHCARSRRIPPSQPSVQPRRADIDIDMPSTPCAAPASTHAATSAPSSSVAPRALRTPRERTCVRAPVTPLPLHHTTLPIPFFARAAGGSLERVCGVTLPPTPPCYTQPLHIFFRNGGTQNVLPPTMIPVKEDGRIPPSSGSPAPSCVAYHHLRSPVLGVSFHLLISSALILVKLVHLTLPLPSSDARLAPGQRRSVEASGRGLAGLEEAGAGGLFSTPGEARPSTAAPLAAADIINPHDAMRRTAATLPRGVGGVGGS